MQPDDFDHPWPLSSIRLVLPIPQLVLPIA